MEASEGDEDEEEVEVSVGRNGTAMSQSRSRKRSVMMTFSIHDPRSTSSVKNTAQRREKMDRGRDREREKCE